MSKAFTRDQNEGPDIPDILPTASSLAPGSKNYITPEGAQKLRDELQRLVEITRPELAEARDDPDAKRQLARLGQGIRQVEESLQAAEDVTPPRGPGDIGRVGPCVRGRGSAGSANSHSVRGR